MNEREWYVKWKLLGFEVTDVTQSMLLTIPESVFTRKLHMFTCGIEEPLERASYYIRRFRQSREEYEAVHGYPPKITREFSWRFEVGDLPMSRENATFASFDTLEEAREHLRAVIAGAPEASLVNGLQKLGRDLWGHS
jgi:hypothetical protein